MRTLIVLATLLLIALKAFAGHQNHRCDSHCRPPGWHHGHTCNTHCTPDVVTVTNTVVVYVTNEVLCSASELPATDFKVSANHSYRLFVANDPKGWVSWGVIRSKSNHTARVVIPLDLAKPLYWQLVDVTPGFPHKALTAFEPTAPDAVTYLALTRGRLYRIKPTAP